MLLCEKYVIVSNYQSKLTTPFEIEVFFFSKSVIKMGGFFGFMTQ